MDFATAQRYLNDPAYHWEKLRHLKPFLLNAVRHKNSKVVAAFVNHKVWGREYCSKDTIETVANSHWNEGWDLLSEHFVRDSGVLGDCLVAARPNPTLFQSTLDQFWNFYAQVPLRGKKRNAFFAGVYQIQLMAIRFNDYDLYLQCKNAYANHNVNPNSLMGASSLIETARKYMCCWAVEDLMRSSDQPLHCLQSFLYTQSLMVEDHQLLKLCRTLLEVSTSPKTDRMELVNLLFIHNVVERPGFNEMCKEIDQLRVNSDQTVYAEEVFHVAYEAHHKGLMDYADALYWCTKVWRQRIDEPATGSTQLYEMLGKLLVDSAKSDNWALVKNIAQQCPDTYQIVLKHVLNHSMEPYGGTANSVDAALHNVNDATDQCIVGSSHTTPSVVAYREKLRLQQVVGEQPATKRRNKI